MVEPINYQKYNNVHKFVLKLCTWWLYVCEGKGKKPCEEYLSLHENYNLGNFFFNLVHLSLYSLQAFFFFYFDELYRYTPYIYAFVPVYSYLY